MKRVICAILGHEYYPDRAIDRKKDYGRRHFRDGSTEPIDTCTVVDVCERCGKERELASPISMAQSHDDAIDGFEIEWR